MRNQIFSTYYDNQERIINHKIIKEQTPMGSLNYSVYPRQVPFEPSCEILIVTFICTEPKLLRPHFLTFQDLKKKK